MLTYRDISDILDKFKSQQGLLAWLLEILWYGKSSLMTYLEALAQHSQYCAETTPLSGTDLSALYKLLENNAASYEGRSITIALNAIIRKKQISLQPSPLTELFGLLNLLNEANLRKDDNVTNLFTIVKNGKGSILFLLFQVKNMLTQENFDRVVQNPELDASTVQALKDVDLLKDNIFHKIAAKEEKSKAFSLAVLYLKHYLALNQKNLEKLLDYPFPEAIEVLCSIGNNLIKQANLDVIFARPEVGEAAVKIWFKEYKHRKMTQDDFDYHVAEIPSGAVFKKLEDDMYEMTPPTQRKSRLTKSGSLDIVSGSDAIESFHIPKKSPTATPMSSPRSSPLLFANTDTADDSVVVSVDSIASPTI